MLHPSHTEQIITRWINFKGALEIEKIQCFSSNNTRFTLFQYRWDHGRMKIFLAILGAFMIGLNNTHPKEKCTVVEPIYGEVKLIKRSLESRPALVTFCFPSLKDCLDYAERNQFHINITYSGRRKEDSEKR
jgi:hypothetical protein